MAPSPTREVTVDRVSNSGNPIAAETHDGKQIHVPAGDPGDVLEVQLVDAGGYYRAKVINTVSGSGRPGPKTNPPTPADETPDLVNIAEKLCGDQQLPVETRHDSSDLAPNEYPGSEHRSEIASRHD